MDIEITMQIILMGKSSRGGWGREQMRLLGVPWPPKHGWVEKVVGTRISREAYNKFLSLKDKHLNKGDGEFSKFESFRSLVQLMKFASDFIDAMPDGTDYCMEDMDLINEIESLSRRLNQSAKVLLENINGDYKE
jgi:hypothetical protein